jgi:hypothetical protein
MLSKMKEDQGIKKLEESKKRLNSGDFDILDIEHDLKHGRNDLTGGQTIDFSEISEEQLESDEVILDEHYQKFFSKFMESSSLVSNFVARDHFLTNPST